MGNTNFLQTSDKIRKFFNEKRLKNYPKIFFIATWGVLFINVFFHNGWRGAFGQIIGTDFITLYSAGLIHQVNIDRLYDFEYQQEIQQTLISPTSLSGVNPFISPPYVAAFYSIFKNIDLEIALTLWTILSLLLTGISGIILSNLLSSGNRSNNLSTLQIIVIMLSFFPIVEGLQVGQNHVFTLLLFTGILYFSGKERYFLAGITSGLLLYKPQFVIGFLIIWFVWGRYKSLVGFLLTSLIIILLSFLSHGPLPYENYLKLTNDLLYIPYLEGFPSYLLTTLYGFFVTLLPEVFINHVKALSLTIYAFGAVLLVIVAIQGKNFPNRMKLHVCLLAALFPLIATPYALLHDLVILIPVIILWSKYTDNNKALFQVVAVYILSLILPLISYPWGVSFVAMIPILVAIGIFMDVNKYRNTMLLART